MSCFAGSGIDVRMVRMNGNSNAVLKYFLTDENSDRNGDQIFFSLSHLRVNLSNFNTHNEISNNTSTTTHKNNIDYPPSPTLGDQICVLKHKTSPSGNRTLVSRVTGGDTHHQGTIHRVLQSLFGILELY